MHLLEIVRVHEHVLIAVLVEIVERLGLDKRALDRIRRLETFRDLDPVGDPPHVDLCRRRAFARMEAFGLEHDVELAVAMFDDVALAQSACNDLDHILARSWIAASGGVLAAPTLFAKPATVPSCRNSPRPGGAPKLTPIAGRFSWRAIASRRRSGHGSKSANSPKSNAVRCRSR